MLERRERSAQEQEGSPSINELELPFQETIFPNLQLLNIIYYVVIK
jgi:hypothetical protein